jgi:hypothetical protein
MERNNILLADLRFTWFPLRLKGAIDIAARSEIRFMSVVIIRLSGTLFSRPELSGALIPRNLYLAVDELGSLYLFSALNRVGTGALDRFCAYLSLDNASRKIVVNV